MTDSNDLPVGSTSECGAGCGCGAPGLSKKNKWLICVLVFLAAASLMSYRLVNRAKAGTAADKPAFDTALSFSGPEDTSTAKAVVFKKGDLWKGELKDLASLNSAAADKGGVLIFLPGRDPVQTNTIKTKIEDAAAKIRSRGTSLAAFTLDKHSDDYIRLTARYSTPSVFTLAAGGGMAVVSDDITVQKLMTAYVKASKPRNSGCCPSSEDCQ